MEKTHLKFCYIYTNNASITQNMRFLYINGFIFETCHIFMESLIIYLHRNVKNSKFIKKMSPLKFDQHPPPPLRRPRRVYFSCLNLTDRISIPRQMARSSVALTAVAFQDHLIRSLSLSDSLHPKRFPGISKPRTWKKDVRAVIDTGKGTKLPHQL